jgi:hypothetical protein
VPYFIDNPRSHDAIQCRSAWPLRIIGLRFLPHAIPAMTDAPRRSRKIVSEQVAQPICDRIEFRVEEIVNCRGEMRVITHQDTKLFERGESSGRDANYISLRCYEGVSPLRQCSGLNLWFPYSRQGASGFCCLLLSLYHLALCRFSIHPSRTRLFYSTEFNYVNIGGLNNSVRGDCCVLLCTRGYCCRLLPTVVAGL